MKRDLLKGLLTFTLAASLQALLAEGPKSNLTTDNFNSRPGVKLSEVKGYLQGNCWFFTDFDVNRSGWAPNMEGDGAMVSGTGSSSTERTGIYTPLLDLSSNVKISFIYSFNQPVSDRRWFKIYAADGNDNPLFLLDSMELTGSGTERIVVLLSDQPIDVEAATRAARAAYERVGGDLVRLPALGLPGEEFSRIFSKP